MTAVEELNSKIDALRKVLEEEKKIVSLDKVLKPSIIDEVLGFDYSFLDTMNFRQLEKYLGAMSQYLIFINKHINQVTVAKICAEDEFKRHLNIAVLSINSKEFGTLEERKSEAMKDENLLELKKHVDALNARIAVHKNIPESVSNLIQTIKKTYDARIKEKYIVNE